MPVPQDKLRTTLGRITSTAIAAFAQQHQSERFYGFAFDCNAEYGQVLLCLNTEEDLLDTAKNLKADPPKPFLEKFDKMMEEKYGVKPKPLYHDKTVPEIVEDLRWETGDWKYQGFYDCNDDPEWAALAAGISEAHESDSETFLETVCRVLPEIQVALACLNRTKDFRALMIDHDESVETAWSRLERLQSQDSD